MASILTNQSITDLNCVLCIKTVLCVLLYNYQFTVYIVTSAVCVWAGLAQQDFLLFLTLIKLRNIKENYS